MKSHKQLTTAAITSAKPLGRPYKLSDSQRLYLYVTVAGTKFFKWNYRLGGKDHTFTIGKFPQIGLSEARKRRMAAEDAVNRGVHPSYDLAEQARLEKLGKAITFWMVADEWMALNKVRWTPKYARQVETYLHRYIRDGSLGSRPLRDVSTSDIFDLISSISNRTSRAEHERKNTGAPALATLVHQYCGAIFRYAKSSGRVDHNPVNDLRAGDVIVRPEVKNNLALKTEELREFLKKLNAYGGQRLTCIAIELLMLTFVRTTELRAATWDEFDIANSLWTIPAHRMKIKNNGAHLVPLSDQALLLLKELKKIAPPAKSGSQYLFANSRRANDCMTATTINRALERMGFAGKGTIGFSGHGFRGTASTHLHEMGERTEVIEAQLAHKERNRTKLAYNKAQYIPERTLMMQRWSDYIDSLRDLTAKVC